MNPIQAAISKITSVARQKFGDNQGWVQNNRISAQPLKQSLYNAGRNVANTPITDIVPAYRNLRQTTQKYNPQAWQSVPTLKSMWQDPTSIPVFGGTYRTAKPIIDYLNPSGYGQDDFGKFKGAMKAMPATAVNLFGTSKLTGAGVVGAGVVGGAFNKLTGGSFSQGAKAGMDMAPSLAGVGAFTNPLIAKGANLVGAKFANPIARQIASRVAVGVGNIPEGMLFRGAGGGGAYGIKDAATDFAFGTVAGSPVAHGIKDSRVKNLVDETKGLSDISDPVQNELYSEMRSAQTKVMDKIKLLRGKYKTDANIPRVIKKELDILKNDWQVKADQWESVYANKNKFDYTPATNLRPHEQEVEKLSASSQIESIIQEGRKSIGKPAEKSVKSIKQFADNLYTQMVDRYHPISLASKKAKKQLEVKGAVLRPEHDPEVLVRRLTGAGSIADTQYRRELKPIIDKLDQFGISKDDMDVYLAHKRIAGFGDVGREIYGADPVKSQSIINAIEAKYGESVKSVADELYLYQDKALKELADSGFLSPEAFQVIKSQNPNYAPLYRVMDEMDNYLGVPTRKTMQGTSPIEKIKGSDRQIISPVESIIANTFRNRAAIEKNRVAQSIIRLQEIAPELGFKKVDKSASDTITIWDKGRKEFWEVGEEIASTAKGLNEENMNTLLKIFTAPASLLRQGATGRNPEFMIPNIIRDQLDASITSKYGYIPFVDYLSGLKSMISNDEVFKRWERSGAKIDLGEMSGRKSIQASFDTVKKKRGLFSWLGGMLDTMGKYSEQPTRVGLFKKAYQKTGNELLSMMESRDATVDFARMGTKMKVANSVIPFLNVGVQGFDKLIRATKNNPSKVLALASFYGILPSVSSTLYNVMYHPQEFAEVPQYEKDANFVFIKGRNKNGTVDYFTIPKGNVIPLIANPTEHFISYMAETDSDSFSKFAVKFLSSALPIVGDGSTVKEVAIKTIGSNLPQLIKPATEALLNRSFYKYDANKEEAKEIVPYYLKSKPGYKQDYEFTPKMYKAIGAVLNVSPLLIKNTMEGYLAGYAKIPAQIIQIMSNISDGKQTNPNDITLLRRFMKQTYDTGTPKKNTKLPVPPLLDRISGSVEASETGSSLYYSIKNTKRLTPEMKEDLLKELPTPKTKGKTKTTSAKTKVKKVKASKSKKAKIKKIKTPKLSAKLPKRKKIKIAKIKINKIKSLQSPKYAKVKTRSSKNLT